MVRSAAVLVTLLLMSCASNQCTRGSEFEPPSCNVKMPSISQISIRYNAARSSLADAGTHCDDFVLNEAQLRTYLSAARQVDAEAAHHALDWSPCHASGDVRFVDGRSGQWTVSQSRIGSLFIDGDEPLTLYCTQCDFAPFK